MAGAAFDARSYEELIASCTAALRISRDELEGWCRRYQGHLDDAEGILADLQEDFDWPEQFPFCGVRYFHFTRAVTPERLLHGISPLYSALGDHLWGDVERAVGRHNLDWPALRTQFEQSPEAFQYHFRQRQETTRGPHAWMVREIYRRQDLVQ